MGGTVLSNNKTPKNIIIVTIFQTSSCARHCDSPLFILWVHSVLSVPVIRARCIHVKNTKLTF